MELNELDFMSVQSSNLAYCSIYIYVNGTIYEKRFFASGVTIGNMPDVEAPEGYSVDWEDASGNTVSASTVITGDMEVFGTYISDDALYKRRITAHEPGDTQ